MLKKMSNIWLKATQFGVESDMDIMQIERIKTFNTFALLCSVFTMPCSIYSISIGDLFTGFTLLVWMILFCFTILLNKNKKHLLSKVLFCFFTCFAVFTTSLGWGFESGIYFYYFIAPAIVFFLFNQDDKLYKLLFVLLYMFSAFALFLLSSTLLPNPLGKYFDFNELKILRWANFLGAFSLAVFLINHFSNLSFLVNQNFKAKNEELLTKQDELNAEIFLKNLARDEIELMFEEQQVMMSEMHHRVKNNLAVISGLLDIQIFKIEDEKISKDLKETQLRIFAISYVHEKLYKLNSYSNIDFGAFVNEFVEMLIVSLSNSNKLIKLHTNVVVHNFNLMQSIPLTMLINELVINSIKHAFAETKNCMITLYIEQCPNSQKINLLYFDNGIGYEADLTRKKSASMGLNIIQSIVKQLKGKASLEKDDGTIFKLVFND